MSASVTVIVVLLVVLGYLVSPIVLILGWARWTGLPKLRTASSTLSLASFILATASALLAVSVTVYAHIHHFAFYDPVLLRIFRWGILLSLGGALIGVGGVWKPNPLRWHAPLSSVGTLAFWIISVEG